jgi:hypothetical protein
MSRRGTIRIPAMQWAEEGMSNLKRALRKVGFHEIRLISTYNDHTVLIHGECDQFPDTDGPPPEYILQKIGEEYLIVGPRATAVG